MLIMIVHRGVMLHQMCAPEARLLVFKWLA